jgi:hypothetical protein
LLRSVYTNIHVGTPAGLVLSLPAVVEMSPRSPVIL